MFRITRKKVAALAVTGALVAGGAVAYAYWTNSGSGSGSASTGSVTANSITISDSAPTNLGPGFGPATVTVTFTNHDNYDEYVTSLKVTLADAGTCTGVADDWWAINGTTYVGTATLTAGVQVPANGTNTMTYTLAFLESSTNQNVCEGQSPAVTVAYAST